MAEVAGADGQTLDQLEAVSIAAAQIRPNDGSPHGVEFRKILPWNDVEALLVSSEPQKAMADALQIGDDALLKLIGHLPTYRKYRPETGIG